MKNSLVACLMLCFSISFAQLSVQNDAYVFVNDQVLFVTDDVNIDDANSKIYLRNEAQLLQGSGTTGNSGVGELSVYQNGTVNQWAYNYWCSPVGGILTNAFGNNDFRIDQLDDPLLSTLSTTDSNNSLFTTAYEGTADPLLISSRWLWMFVSSDEYSEWIPAAIGGNANVDINPGLGFTMKGTGTATTGNTDYDFRGKPNNGTILVNGIDTGGAGTVPSVSRTDYLLGNPYPSAIDAQQFILDNGPTIEGSGNTTGTLYFWEHWGGGSHVLQEYQGGYALYNLSGGVPAPAPDPDVAQVGVGTKTPGQYIPVGQGFFVSGISTGPITFENDQRVFAKEGGSSSLFLRGNNTSRIEIDAQTEINTEEIDDRMKFRIGFNAANSLELHRQLLLTIDERATTDVDWAYDGKMNETQTDDMYWVINDESYVIQGSDEAVPSSVYPLGLKTNTEGVNTIKIDELENVPGDIKIYVHDIELDLYHDLRQSDYEVYLDAGVYENRFVLAAGLPNWGLSKIKTAVSSASGSASSTGIILRARANVPNGKVNIAWPWVV